ncbi:MAG TPA: DUF1800 family protein, partial [Acidobacteriaceae bacterium]|nr:DUF1800 family protein [Acidobacteriaceae bacterium]
MRTSSWTVAGQPARILASFLIFTLVQNPAGLLGEGAFSRHKKVVLPSGQLSGDERSLHALNRLTFGPQPGDLQRVNAIGLEKWVDLQLNPEKIDDSLLAAQLRNYPIMQMPLPQMVAAFPSAALIRNAAEGKRALPADRIERAIYQNQIFDYQQRKERQAQEAAALQSAPEGPGGEPQAQPASQPLAPPSSGAGAANQPGTDGKGEAIADAMALEDVASSPSIQVHEQKLYADLASTAIVNLPPDQRWNRLINMTPEQFRNFVRSLTPEERLQVTQGMSPQQKEAIFALVNPTLVVAGELLQTRLLTDIYSKRQLQ